MSQSFQYRQEVYRKLIHLSSLWMPVAIYFLAWETALAAFAAGMIMVLAYEIIRRQNSRIAHLLERLLGPALRPDEKERRFKPSGAIYVLTAAFLLTLLFPKPVAVTALAMVLTGDTAAALIGRKFGRRKIFDKSLEGTLAFFVTALATAAVLPGTAFAAATAAALTAALVELVSKKVYIDDNLSAPLAAAAVLTFLM
jgi:dolichol kinase